MTDEDPRAKYRQLPNRVRPDEWVEEQPADAVPGSVQAAADDEQARAARYEIERAGGFG